MVDTGVSLSVAMPPPPSSSSSSMLSSTSQPPSTQHHGDATEEARRRKRKEQNRLAQRRHREKARHELKKQRNSGGGVDGANDGNANSVRHVMIAASSNSAEPQGPSPICLASPERLSQNNMTGSSHLNNIPTPSVAGTDGGLLLGPVRLGSGGIDVTRDNHSSIDVQDDMYLGSSRNDSTSSTSDILSVQHQRPVTSLLSDLPSAPSSVAQSLTTQLRNRFATHQGIATGDEEAMRSFVTMTALAIPWANRLLKPRWDLMKVLQLATQRLGLTFDYIEEDSSISFLALDFQSASDARMIAAGSQNGSGQGTSALAPTLRWHVVPDNMKPSTLSSAVPHHPFVDLSFPWPTVRDKILTAATCGIVNEHDLCVDIWPGDSYQESGAEPPYWVHGDDAFDPEAYEVSDRFARKYPWLLDASIIRRTNWWRRQQSKNELPQEIVRLSQSFAPLLSKQMSRLLASGATLSSPASTSLLSSMAPLSPADSTLGSSRFASVKDEPMLGLQEAVSAAAIPAAAVSAMTMPMTAYTPCSPDEAQSIPAVPVMPHVPTVAAAPSRHLQASTPMQPHHLHQPDHHHHHHMFPNDSMSFM